MTTQPEIPDDIMEEASRLTESAWQLKHPELAAKVAAALLAERKRTIEECRRAIRDTLNPDNYERSDEFILMGPAGIIRRADAAIRALLK